MLSPCEESETPSYDFSVCDIETRPDGKPFLVGFFDGEQATHFPDWFSAFPFLKSRSRFDKRFRKIYAHNGGGFDWLSLIHYLGQNEREVKIGCSLNGSSVISVCIKFPDGRKIDMLDSLHLLRSSLDKAAKAILGKGKKELPGEHYEVFKKSPKLFMEYWENDCTLLYGCIREFFDMVRSRVAKIGNLGITLPSTAMKVFRTGFLKRDIEIPTCERLRKFLREGYYGGRVEVFRPGYFPKVYVYDINSLYPSVMVRTPVPVSGSGFWTNNYHEGMVGVYRGTFKQDSFRSIPSLIRSGEGSLEGKGVFFSNEIERLSRVGTFDVEEGFVFEESEIIFREYVERLYSLRMENKGNAIDIIAKYLLNQLYGKFGQTPERRSIIFVEDFDQLYTMIKSEEFQEPIEIDAERGVYSVVEDSPAMYEHVGIAGTITSESRATLWESMKDLGKSVVYCDTDSVHTTSPMKSEKIGSELGKFKLEFCGEGVYAGKKLYALKDGLVEKVRAKGVRVGKKKDQHNLLFSNLVELVGGKTIECVYSTPTTPMETFKGKEPCVWRGRKRRIRMTAKRR